MSLTSSKEQLLDRHPDIFDRKLYSSIMKKLDTMSVFLLVEAITKLKDSFGQNNKPQMKDRFIDD